MTGASMLNYELAARLSAASERDDSLELRDALEAGQSIHYGRYLIHGVLGRGSFATVYDGEHVGLGRRVAIKVPRLRSENMPSLHERFVREARTSVLVQHPNVLGIYDCGTLVDGTPFLVLERVNGDSLTTIIERGPVSFALVIELGRQLARALSALADVGIVHRDIKPDNVMLHRSKYGIMLVKLVDFGVAKRSKWQAPVSLTLQGELVGTPQYMAAEQLRGEEVDTRTDIYAVAAVLYEALTGRPPHESTNFSDYLVAALSNAVRPIRELRPDCPPELERIILRALERDRALRHDTPEQLLEELNACKLKLNLDGETARATAHAMALELEGTSHESTLGSGRLSSALITQAVAVFRRRSDYELDEEWQARLDNAKAVSAAYAHRTGDFLRRVAPNLPKLSLLMCLLLFTRSESLAFPANAASGVVRPATKPQPVGEGSRIVALEKAAARQTEPVPQRVDIPSDPRSSAKAARATEPLLRGLEPPRSLSGRGPADLRSRAEQARGATATQRAPLKPPSEPSAARATAPALSSTGEQSTASHAPTARARPEGPLAPTSVEPSRTRPQSNERALGATTRDDPLAGLDRNATTSDEREAPAQNTTARPRTDEPRASTSALLAQALSAFVSGRVEEAKTHYQQVLRSEPNNPAALRGMGLTATRLGDKKVARDSLRRYLEVSPKAPDAAAIEARLATLKP
jgi:serine/threonine protein kinase